MCGEWVEGCVESGRGMSGEWVEGCVESGLRVVWTVKRREWAVESGVWCVGCGLKYCSWSQLTNNLASAYR